MRLSVIIPAYNENGSLLTLLKRVCAVPIEKEIIIVDDGSDVSPVPQIESAELPNVRCIIHSENRGKGAAIRTGLHTATGDYVVIQDADLEYYPEDFVVMMGALSAEHANAVFGVRDLSKRSWLMRTGNQALTWVTNLLYAGKLRDMETCYKMISRPLILSLDLVGNGFEIEAEITCKLLRMRAAIIEVPIRYDARTQGKKLSPLDGIPTLMVLLAHVLWKGSTPPSEVLAKS